MLSIIREVKEILDEFSILKKFTFIHLFIQPIITEDQLCTLPNAKHQDIKSLIWAFQELTHKSRGM